MAEEEKPKEKSFSGSEKPKDYPAQRREAAAEAERFRTAGKESMATPKREVEIPEYSAEFSPEFLEMEKKAIASDPEYSAEHELWIGGGPRHELTRNEVQRLFGTYLSLGGSSTLGALNHFKAFLDAELRRRHDPEAGEKAGMFRRGTEIKRAKDAERAKEQEEQLREHWESFIPRAKEDVEEWVKGVKKNNPKIWAPKEE